MGSDYAFSYHTRRWPRSNADVPVTVSTQHSNGCVYQGRARQLSRGGTALFAGFELAVGDQVEIELATATGEKAKLTSVVRHRMGFKYGVEFIPNGAGHESSLRDIEQSIMDSAKSV